MPSGDSAIQATFFLFSKDKVLDLLLDWFSTASLQVQAGVLMFLQDDSLDKVKDRHSVPNGREDRVTIRRKDDVSLPIDRPAQVLKLVVGLHVGREQCATSAMTVYKCFQKVD